MRVKGTNDRLRSTTLSLSTTAPAAYQVAAPLSLSNPDASTLRLTSAGGAAKDWSSTVVTGAALIHPTALTIGGQGMSYGVHIDAIRTEASANGVGWGIGFSPEAAGPFTTWAARVVDKDGSGTVRIRNNSNSQTNAVATGATFLGGMAIQASGRSIGVAVAMTSLVNYDKADPTVSGNPGQLGSNYFNYSGVTSLYAIAFGVTGTTAGTADLKGIRATTWAIPRLTG